MALAEWVANAGPPYDLWAVDIRLFGRPHFDTDWVRARTYKAYGKHYTMARPAEEHDSGCPCRKSPLYQRLKVDGAVFGKDLAGNGPIGRPTLMWPSNSVISIRLNAPTGMPQ